ncbi:SIS domain-containing protein [Ignatzschineria indica]|uniref:SIS domain-containing protein n=1 Tax=Ignatzschineria indica TaxID=472583 RepID=UPI00257772B5|nr:SIS domain-containing protein [Ignatzschineria indica]MDM1544326.1 SIS domain-containing protein [Ignatzschineria indica]
MSTYMAKEILDIPNVIEHQNEANASTLIALAEYLKKKQPNQIITLGRGSSYNASIYGKYLFETGLGVPVSVAAPSLATVYQRALKTDNAILIVTSQSGKSPDLITFAKMMRAQGTKVIGIINDEESPLAKECDFLFGIKAGEEKSVAATKSFVGSLSIYAAIFAAWSEDGALADALLNLPLALEEAVNSEWPTLIDHLSHAKDLFIIGRGVGLSAAVEAALKLKETCQIHAEGISASEIFHGSVSLITPQYPVISFIGSDQSRASCLEINKKLEGYGAQVFSVASKAGDEYTLAVPEVHPLLQPLVQISAYYRVIEKLSKHRGLDPDLPPNLKKVTETL